MSTKARRMLSGGGQKLPACGFAGGMKKSGLVPSNGRFHDVVTHIKTKATVSAERRKIIFCVNMLGGIGAGRSQFNVPGSYTNKRGSHCTGPFEFTCLGRF